MRASGIILHITSLPSPYGVGTLGKEAYAFADFLERAGQKYWQILPLGPTGFGDSPYQSDSAFAGNPYLIDLNELIAKGLLMQDEVEQIFWGDDPKRVDYGALYAGRWSLLRLACERGWERERESVETFYRENENWLRDYALYSAAKQHFGQRPWTEWPDEELRRRTNGEVLHRYEELLQENIRVCIFTQYLFFRQWNALRGYIKEKGIKIIGDVPIYVPLDSADVWAHGDCFRLDEQCRPVEVAGVPPDYFSADGQLWGNPLYDWGKMRIDGYHWWIDRLRAAARLYDTVRIDHFRGLESYWTVPYGEKTARCGTWRQGPGREFIDAIRTALPTLDILAEDLGILTPEVTSLREYSGFPGMKVLQFAFDDRQNPSEYLPHRYAPHCVCYTGTHDNETLPGWLQSVPPETLAYAECYFGLNEREGYANGILRGGMSSAAELFISQMQDWLGLGHEARMNTPGTLGGNWCWRTEKNVLTDALAEHIAGMTHLFGR